MNYNMKMLKDIGNQRATESKQEDEMNYKNNDDIKRYLAWLESELIEDLKQDNRANVAFELERLIRIIRDNGILKEKS